MQKSTEELLLPISQKLDKLQEQIDDLKPPAPQPASRESTLLIYSPNGATDIVEDPRSAKNAMRITASELDGSSSNMLCAARAN
jgi:hypothetical protein